nr:MAG TPA: Enolase [Caudoviricetes sp.]
MSWLLGSSDVSTIPEMGVGKLLIRFPKQGSYGNVSKR